MILIKIQYINYETNEFAYEQNADLDTLLEIFEKHTQLINTNHSYTIINQGIRFYLQNGNNFLRICHFSKEAFTIMYLDEFNDKSFTGNFYKKSIILLLHYFYENDSKNLIKNIPISKVPKKQLLNEFITSDFIYKYNNKITNGLIFYCILYSLAIIFFIITYISSMSSFGFILTSPFVLLLLSLLISFLKIEKNYIKHSFGLKIKISLNSDNISIFENKKEFSFQKNDIKYVNYITAHGFRNPFSDYGWTLIRLNDGSKFVITHKIIDPMALRIKLSKTHSMEEEVYYPYILKKYLNK